MGQLVYINSELVYIYKRNENDLVIYIRPEAKWSNHD